jgi:hypothetical protein
MSGIELLGAIGSAVSVIEGIMAAKSYLSDFRQSTKQKQEIKNELQHINGLVVSLEGVISSMPHDIPLDSLSQAFNHFKLSLEKTQSTVQQSNSRIMWTADKTKIKELRNQYERLGTILNVSFAGYNT